MFHTRNRREPGSRWTCYANRLHQEAVLPWVTQPFASSPSKSSQYRAEMLPGKGTGNAGTTPIFWYFVIMVNIATYVSSGRSKMSRFLVQGFLTVSWCWKAASLKVSFFFFFQNKLFNINADYPIAHFRESNGNFQSFGDLIFLWIYGQPPRSLQHDLFSPSSVFLRRTP